jgi:DNA-binding response OmpR family regulator
MGTTDIAEGHGSARSVLIVDDEQDTLEILADLLRALGHNVRIATCGREAICVAQDFAPELILVDLGLPDISGRELIQALRANPRTKAAYIVVITGWGPRTQDVGHASEAGFDRYVVKPIDVGQIRDILRSSTHAKSP